MIRLFVLLLILLAFTAPAAAAHDLTPDQLRTVRFDQQLGQALPLDLQFTDENGTPVTLEQFFGQRPVILTLNYFHCQNLCPLELEGLISGLNGVSFSPGTDFNLVTVSIDPREGPADATTTKAQALRGYDRPQDANGWHVLTGSQASIDELTDAVGFHYLYDPQQDDFAHPAGVVVLTPDGQVSRYLFGLDFSANDLRLALLEAGQGKVGSLLDRALLVCYHFDPLTGRYTPLALNIIHVGGAAGALAIFTFLGMLWRAELRRPRG